MSCGGGRGRDRGRVKIKTPNSGISAFDRLRLHAERLVDGAVVAAPAGQMPYLNCDIWGYRRHPQAYSFIGHIPFSIPL
jgi:hypothetical protein